MVTKKRGAASRPAVKKLEGDLFPRGRSEGSQPRVRKRDGTVLFAGDAAAAAAAAAQPARKRSRTAVAAAATPGTRAAKHGLSCSRLAVGMTLLGVVTAASEKAVHIALPGGINASADPFEVLVEESEGALAAQSGGGLSVFRARADPEDDDAGSESESEADTESDESSDGTEDGPRPLYKVVTPGDVVRTVVVSAEKDAGLWKVFVSCRPSLVNVNVGIVGGSVSGVRAATVLREGELMWGAIKSREDHGYVVDFGPSVPSLGFLNFTEVGTVGLPNASGESGIYAASDTAPRELVPGSPVEVLVLESALKGKKAKKVVRVSSAVDKVNAAVTEHTPEMTIASMRAGVRVPARISRVDDGGVEVSVFGVFPALVERAHLPTDLEASVGSTVPARLLYVDAGSKRIGVTLQRCLVEERRPAVVPREWKVGQVIQCSTVTRVDPGYGVFLVAKESSVIPSDGNRKQDGEKLLREDIPLFAHASRVADEHVEKLGSMFHRGLALDSGARIVSFSALDGVVNVDLRSTTLARKALSISEVVPGEMYTCKIASHSKSGSLFVGVDGDMRIPGIVPSAYVSDTPISSKRLASHTRFKVGAQVKCICVKIDERKGKVILIAKRSLVNAEYPVLGSYEQAGKALEQAKSSSSEDDVSNCVFCGSVASVTSNHGVLVVFSGDVRGIVHGPELALDTRHSEISSKERGRNGVAKPSARPTREQLEALYPSGQTVAVRVLHVDVLKQRMSLSFNLSSRPPCIVTTPVLSPGSFVTAKIVGVETDERIFRAKATSSIAQQAPQSSECVGVFECSLPFEHLADSSELSKRIAGEILKTFSSESSPIEIGEALVLCEKTASRPAVITLKVSLMSARRECRLPASFSEIEKIYEADTKGSTGVDARDEVDAGQAVGSSSRPRTVLRGYVKAAMPSGVIVGFVGTLAGLARKSRISDEFIADPSKAVQVHQSVSVVVESIDSEAGRFTLSLRSSDVGLVAIAEDTRNFFDVLLSVTERFGRPPVEREFPVGAVVTSVVDTSRPYGMVLNLESSTGAKAYGVVLDQARVRDQTSKSAEGGASISTSQQETAESESIASAAASTALAYASSEQDKNLKVGPSSTRKTRRQRAVEDGASKGPTPARVLDVDPFSGVVDVSLDPGVVETAGKRQLSASAKVRTSKILLLKDEYVILSVPRTNRQTAIAFALLPAICRHLRLQISPGRDVPCTLLDSAKTRRNLACVDWSAFGSALTQAKDASEARSLAEAQLAGSPSKKLGLSKQPVSLDDVKVGMLLSGRVTSARPLQVDVAVSRGIVGRVHVSNYHSLNSEILAALPLGMLPEPHSKGFHLPRRVGTTLSSLRVVGLRSGSGSTADGKEEKYLELARGAHSEGSKLDDEQNDLEQNRVGFVKKVVLSECGLVNRVWLDLSPSLVGCCTGVDALIPGVTCELSNNKESAKKIFQVGQAFVCRVVAHSTDGGAQCSVVLSTNGAGTGAFWGRILSYKPGAGLRVEMPSLARRGSHGDSRCGIVDICDISDDFDEALKLCGTVKAGDVVCVRRVHDILGEDVPRLSMRQSDLRVKTDVSVRDPATISLPSKSSIGQQCRGFVRSIGKSGCFVSIGRGIVARILLSDLSDEFVEKPEDMFPVGKLVSGKITQVSNDVKGKVQMSFRTKERQRLKGRKSLASSPATGNESRAERREVFDEGSVVRAVVRKIEKFGALVSLGSSSTTALLHKSEADQDRLVADPWKEWRVGQSLTVVMIQAGDSGKLRVGTKRCYLEAAGLDSEKVDDILEENAAFMSASSSRKVKGRDAEQNCDEAADDKGDGGANSDVQDSDDDADSSEDEREAENDAMSVSSESSSSEAPVEDEDMDDAPALNISKGFVFDDSAGGADGGRAVDTDEEEDESEDTSDSDAGDVQSANPQKSSKRKREKKRAKEAAEREIREREEALAQRSDAPETAEDFERLLIGSPNASHVWIRYMAFRVSLSQIEKARALAERSLETISLTEELERVNMWIAYMNLEATFGSRKSGGVSQQQSVSDLRNRAAAVFRVFERACERVTDVEDLHLQAAAALRRQHPDLADEILKRALKGFKRSKDVWIAVGSAQFASGRLDAARQTLERALLSLSKQDHVAIIMKFAQLEYRHGSHERGRTVFESLCANFPKRLDIWNVYMDMEKGRYRRAVEDGEEDEAAATRDSLRLLLERCASLDLSTKKTKFVFKKWLAFEVETGDKEAQQRVRSKARAYVETKLVPST